MFPEVQNRSRVFYTLATSAVKNIDILIFFFSILKSKNDAIWLLRIYRYYIEATYGAANTHTNTPSASSATPPPPRRNFCGCQYWKSFRESILKILQISYWSLKYSIVTTRMADFTRTWQLIQYRMWDQRGHQESSIHISFVFNMLYHLYMLQIWHTGPSTMSCTRCDSLNVPKSVFYFLSRELDVASSVQACTLIIPFTMSSFPFPQFSRLLK